jgi:uncharacterized protein (DUF2147 family)
MILIAAFVASAAARPNADPAIGTWINPKGTVTVSIVRCGRAICGKVIAAAPSAQEAARAAGTAKLVGTEILHDLRPAGPGRWAGEAFIPDLGITAEATMTQLSRDELQIEGCRLGGYLCRRQVWHRVAARGRGR